MGWTAITSITQETQKLKGLTHVTAAKALIPLLAEGADRNDQISNDSRSESLGNLWAFSFYIWSTKNKALGRFLIIEWFDSRSRLTV